MAAMFVNGSGQNEQYLERTFHRCFLPSFTSLAEGFQRRRLKCEKLTDDRRRMPSDGKSSHCLWQGELKMCWYYYMVSELFLQLLQYFMTNCELHLDFAD
jgi:hypothetical protein